MRYLLLILVCNIFHVQSCRSHGLHGLHDEEAQDSTNGHVIRVQRVTQEMAGASTKNSMERIDEGETGSRKSNDKVAKETNDLQRPFDDLGVYKNRLNVEKLLRPNEDELKSLSDLSKLLKNGILMDAATRMDFVQNYFEKFCRRHRAIPLANSKMAKDVESSDQPKKISIL